MSPKNYNKSNITQWMWYFKKYKYVRGVIFRIFGVYVNIRERNSFEKLIAIANR